MIHRMEAFSILEIEPTMDKKQIKRAYANQVKKYHPEENQEEWKKIREAYEAAIFYAERETDIYQEPLEDELRGTIDGACFAREDKNEFHEMFERLDGFVTDQRLEIAKEQDKIIEQVVCELEKISKSRELGVWEEFFDSYDIELFCSSEFLYKWADVLLHIKLTGELYNLFKSKLDEISQYCNKNQIVPRQTMPIPPIEMVNGRLVKPGLGRTIFSTICWIITIVSFMIYSVDTTENEYERLYGNIRGESLLVHLEETIELVTNPVKKGYFDLVDECGENGLQSSLLEMQERYEMVQTDVQEADLWYVENGILLHDGLYLSGWENEIEQQILYEEITEIENLERKARQKIEENEFYAVKISAEEWANACAICFIPEKLGLDENCKIYYSYGNKYIEVEEWNEQTDNLKRTKEIYVFHFSDYRAFSIVAPAVGKVTLLFVNE